MLLEQILPIFHEHGLSVQTAGQRISVSGAEADIFQALKQALVMASEMENASLEIKLARSRPPLEGGHDLLCYRTIGHVENDFNQPSNPQLMRSSESRLLLEPSLSAGLQGIEAGQKLLVLFDFHLPKGYALLQHPRGDQQLPQPPQFNRHQRSRSHLSGAKSSRRPRARRAQTIAYP